MVLSISKQIKKTSELINFLEDTISDLLCIDDALPDTRKKTVNKYKEKDEKLTKKKIQKVCDDLIEKIQIELDSLANVLNFSPTYEIRTSASDIEADMYHKDENGQMVKIHETAFYIINELKRYLKRLNARAIDPNNKVKENDDNKFSQKLPLGTKWEDMEIKFKNEFDIEIFIKQKFFKKYSNIDLGFYGGTKEKKPDRQWQFLILLSTLQGKYEKTATKNDLALSLTNKIGKKITLNNCEQIAKNLLEKLSNIFGISDSLYSYKEHGYYKPKFKLTPVPMIRGSGEVHVLPRNELKEDYNYKKKREPDEDGFVSL